MAFKLENQEFWDKEYEKCLASPYYFAITYMVIIAPNKEKLKFTTRLSEEEFNKLCKLDKYEDTDRGNIHG